MSIVKSSVVDSPPGVNAEVLNYLVWNIPGNALVIKFDEPRSSLSGDRGYRRSRIICNCYLPKDLCDHLHSIKQDYGFFLRDLGKAVAEFYKIKPADISMVSTGVDMREMAYSVESTEDLWVATWVTAGFKHNAMRVGVDPAYGFEVSGKYRPCGTINIIVTSNARLSLATMASSFITITEAKGIALQDLLIHSSFNPNLQATGTGTDQIVIISGKDFTCRYAGGHTKLGELLAKTVTEACKTACKLQLAKDPNYHSISNLGQG